MKLYWNYENINCDMSSSKIVMTILKLMQLKNIEKNKNINEIKCASEI